MEKNLRAFVVGNFNSHLRREIITDQEKPSNADCRLQNDNKGLKDIYQLKFVVQNILN